MTDTQILFLAMTTMFTGFMLGRYYEIVTMRPGQCRRCRLATIRLERNKRAARAAVEKQFDE